MPVRRSRTHSTIHTIQKTYSPAILSVTDPRSVTGAVTMEDDAFPCRYSIPLHGRFTAIQ